MLSGPYATRFQVQSPRYRVQRELSGGGLIG